MSFLLLEPYAVMGYDALVLYLQSTGTMITMHRLYPEMMAADFWNTLYGKADAGYLETAHIVLWSRLLLERCPSDARWTIASPTFFGQGERDWIRFAMGALPEPNKGKPWWEVDRIFFPIHVDVSLGHRVLGELTLDTFTFTLYDSCLEVGSYEWLKKNGQFERCKLEVGKILDDIDYWSKRQLVPVPVNLKFIYYNDVPQQGTILGDCGVFVCMFLEQLVSGLQAKITTNSVEAGQVFRYRIASIF